MDDELNFMDSKKKDDFNKDKSMSEILKEKRQETEKILEDTKVNQ